MSPKGVNIRHLVSEATCPYQGHSHPEPIDAVLRRRGQVIKRTGDWSKTLLPDVAHAGVVFERFGQFKDFFGRGSFRSLLRRVTAAAGRPVPIESLPAIKAAVLRCYLDFLRDAGLVEEVGGAVRCLRTLQDIGSTLEWYVAQVCVDDLYGSADWGVRFDGIPVNGDFDVLAWLEPTLVYVETKSAAPKSIKVRDLQQFLQRTHILSPEISILLVDTSDDVTPVLETLTRAMLPAVRALYNEPAGWRPDAHFGRPSKTFPSVWQVHCAGLTVHVVNSEPSIFEQLRRCLQHYHAKVKGEVPVDGRVTRVNWLTGATDET